ncbi:MAG: tRNA (N(6)-L-threonylcarbamoyladenosine(37)-C(2))-methylthiotransferase MtaB [Planctomycetota bacterium]|jgi:threonylcarbamoyladenosine tRNA methylthiotransferase MtaB
MKTFAIETLGCKVNQYESQQIRELLERFGLCQVKFLDEADLIIINSCCVTHVASAKSRQHVRKAQKSSPDAVTVVCGCLPAMQEENLTDLGDNLHVIRCSDDLAATLGQMVTTHGSGATTICTQPILSNIIKAQNAEEIKHKRKISDQIELPQLSHFAGQTRAFLKIQDGCDGYCCYCIIPKTRPHVRSKPAEQALREAQVLVRAGHKEIVLTGICLGAYGQETVRQKSWESPESNHLADLLENMARIRNLKRIRLSSLGPSDLTSRLLDVFSNHRNIMPHLHLSLQSGSNAVLKRMCRRYRRDDFMNTVEAIRSRLDRPAITTDIIVGFPGETEADFRQTVGLARDVGFAKMHVFGFSPREGTTAAEMQGVVNNGVMKERSRILHDLDEELRWEFRQQFMGETTEILVEEGAGESCGRSERYFPVFLENPGSRPRKNELVKVKLVGNMDGGAIGIIPPGQV